MTRHLTAMRPAPKIARYGRLRLQAAVLIPLITAGALGTVAAQAADMRVRVYGTTALVTGTVIRSRDGTRIGRNVFANVFVKRDGRWRAVSAEKTMVSSDR